MGGKHPYNEDKLWNSASYMRDSWLYQRSKLAMPALSHWHAANMDELVRETRIKRNFEDYYWGALLLTDSYIAWGGASLNAYTMIGLDLRWVDMISLVSRNQAVPVRRPPPDDYLQLVVVISKRPSPNSIVGFPGAQPLDRSRPVTSGSSVIWGWAVPRSPAEQMMVYLNRQLSGGEFGEWVYETDSSKKVLARVASLEEEQEREQAESFSRRFEGYDDVQMPDEGGVFCGQCGVKNPSTSNFCAKCGERLVKL